MNVFTKLAEKFYYTINLVTNYYGPYVGDKDDLRSYLNLEFTKLLPKFDEDRGDAHMFFKSSLFSKARRYIVEIHKPYKERYMLTDDMGEFAGGTATASPFLEDILHVIQEVANKAEKEIVAAVLRHSEDSFTSAVNKGGFHHQEARRHMNRLAKKVKFYREL